MRKRRRPGRSGPGGTPVSAAQPWEEITIDLGITSRWAKDRHREALKAVERILEEKSFVLPEP